ncbi:7348_t:CDS:10 [Funneliformis caledonium]|uniref:non-specific serine/threonine protein kinase n=1 Tax=Funneliformis caledonium TaxID=1117310 RepID=A0A9N8W607_9GLOM|nr:7348_t:CDS:10 [Funneliformis caledonium]
MVGVLPTNTVSTKRNRIFNAHTARRTESVKLSRVHQLLSRIRDESDTVYSRRLSHVHQLTSLLADPCSTWEKIQIFEAVTRIQGGLETVFEDIRAPVNFKTAVAKCLALIAFNLNNEINTYFRWLLERLQIANTNSIEREKERKFWILFSLKEVLSRNVSGTSSQNTLISGPFQQYIPGLLQDLESLLDSMDSSDFFPGILEVLEKIAEKYPQEFGDRFKDVIDLLVGWYIDISVSNSLHSLIADTFKKLRPFWSQYLNFAYELMNHFLADMEVLSGVTVSQEGPQIDKQSKTEGETMPNLKALLSCFHAVADAVGTILPQVTLDELDETTISENTHPYDRLRAWIIKFILVIGEMYMDIEWFEKEKFLTFHPGNQIIQTLSMSRKPLFIQHQIQAAKFWLLQIQDGFHINISIQSVDEWFDGFLQVLVQWIPSIHPEVIYTLINPDSALMKLRWNSYGARLNSDLLDMLHIVLQNQVSVIPRCKTNEMTLIHQITIEIGIMMSLVFRSDGSSRISSHLHWRDILKRNEFDHDHTIVQFLESLRSLLNSTDKPLKDCSLNIRTATSILIFDIKILTDIAYSWNHNRETFWVFYVMLNKIGESGQFDGLVMCTLLKSLRQVCRSKDYFMTEIKIDSSLPSTFCAMVTTLTVLLRYPNEFSSNVLALALDWFEDILEFCSGKQFHIKEINEIIRKEFDNIIFSLVITARVLRNNDIRLQIPKVICNYFDVFGSLKFHKNSMIKVAHRLFDSDINVQSEFSKLINSINPLYCTFRIDPLIDQFVVNFKKNISSTPHLGNFRPPHFQIVMSRLGMNELLSSQDETIIISDDTYEKGQWLLRLFHSCQSIEGFDKENHIEDEGNMKYVYSESDIAGTIANSNDLLTFWSLWEVVRYCVLSRLRTPFGGPKQTFDAFEKRLNDLLIQDVDIPISYGLDETNIHDSMHNLNQLRDLLILIDRLELQIYNAAVGTALGRLPQAPRASIIFFRANRKVCDDWFSRMRPSIINGSKIIGHDVMAIRHGLLSLMERVNLLKQGAIKSRMTWMMEFQQMLMDVVQCLQRIRAVDSIIGLLNWSKRVCISNNEKPESGSLGQHDEVQMGDKASTSTLPQSSVTQRVLLQRKPTNKTIPSSAYFYWMNNSHLFAEAKYEFTVKESKEALSNLLELDPEMQVITPQVQFLTAQIIDSYCKMEDLSSLAEWLNDFGIYENTLDPLARLNQHYLESLAKYHVGEHLSAWELIETNSPRTSSHHINLRGSNFIYSLCLFHEMLARIHEAPVVESHSTYAILKAAAQLALENSLINTIPLLAKATVVKSNAKNVQDFLDEFINCTRGTQQMTFSNTFINDLEIWSAVNSSIDQMLIRNETPQPEQPIHKKLGRFRLMMANIARKSSAFRMANSLLDHWKQDLPPEVIIEHAKTMYAQGQYQNAIIRACSIFGGKEHNKSTPTVFFDSQGFEQRICLKIAKWIQNSETVIKNETLSEISGFLGETITKKAINEAKPINDIESRSSIVEACLSFAIKGESSYNKAWFSYATYHYQRGRQILEELSSGKTTINLITVSRNTIQEALTNDWQNTNHDHPIGFDLLFKALFQLFLRKFESHSKFENDEREGSEFKEIIPWISEKSTEIITTILYNLQEEIFASYKCAVEGYFKYLQLANGIRKDGTNRREDICDKRVEESDITTATLRILRLLVKHGACLESEFTQGFDSTDYRVWENIIPQLFSRLDHPDLIVQQQLCKLLCVIATNSPHLVIYNIVVALNSGGTSEQNKQLLRKIADNLDDSKGVLIAEIRQVIKEFHNITVLWEEHWSNKIIGLQLDVNKRLHKIDNEFERINDNLNLTSDNRNKIMKEVYDTIMKPVISSIERLYNTTIMTASTPHERWFNQTFGSRIHDALEKLRTPTSWHTYKEGWDLFRNVHKDLTKELQISRTLKLSDLSPLLSRIKSSQITMPGLTTHHETIFIQSFDDNVVILPTKTKPKKLILLGSDGKQYGYLFKGHEDLHLDERIMQLLQITNNLLNRDKQARSRKLKARHYVVIPLGNHSGMIQWVENATQMFVLYKKWQHREHFAKHLQTNNAEMVGNPLRPSDMFFEKIGKALKKEGWAASSSRRNWPKSVLKSVFLELVSETPSDLLEKEVWSSCSSPSEWWDKNVSLSRSLAVMSIIGYIIGLGDRHLDNMLIDFDRGEVVHIDYNVCFEKGKKLRVPETVPFRLTQNLETALGITGVEGVFRIACENVLRVMKKNKEMLIALLEAFVYDPLVDWNQNLLEDKDKQIMELAENIGLLTSRIAELRAPLEDYQKQLSDIVLEFLKAYENLWDNHHEIKRDVESSVNESQQSLQAGPSLSNVEMGSVNNNQLELASLKTMLSQRANECALWHAQHEKTIQSVQGPLLQVMYNEVFASSQIGSTLFRTFMQMLSTNEHLHQLCLKINQDFFGWINERNHAFKNCLERLQFYQTLILPIIQDLLKQDYYGKWSHLLSEFLDSRFEKEDFQKIFEHVNLEKPPDQFEFNTDEISMIDMRKTEIDIELQQRQMELMRIEWINETSIGDDSSIRKQFLEDLTQDVNIFIRLDSLLQELTAQYRTIEVDITEMIIAKKLTTPESEGDAALQSFNDDVTNQQILFAQEFERMKHIVSLCNSILHLESFRMISEKTKTMDVDTLQLVKRLEGVVYRVKSTTNPGLDITQQLSSLEFGPSSGKGLSRELEVIAKEAHNIFGEIHSLMLDLILLIDPIINVEVDIDDIGKNVRSRAKDFMHEWSKFDIEVIDNSLTIFDGRQAQNDIIMESLYQESVRNISDFLNTLSRVFEQLFKLCEVSAENDQNYSRQPSTSSLEISSVPKQSITTSGTNLEIDCAQISAPTETNRFQDITSEYVDQNEVYSNPISSQKDDQAQSLKDNIIRRSSLIIAEGIQNVGTAQTRNSFAVGVIRRVKSKLEGKDFDLNTKMNISEQVDKIIQQAIDIDNLCFRNQYDNDTSTWSPQGRIHQIEYALEAVKQGSAAVGLRSNTHAVLLALKRSSDELASYQKKLIRIDDHLGIAIAGLTSDARVLSNFMRTEAMKSKMIYNRPLPIFRIVSAIGDKAQANTQNYGRRPYGVGLLVAGFDETGPHLYECVPSGDFFEYYAMSIGARSQSAKTYLEKYYESFAEASLEELVRHGLHALRDTLQQDKELNNRNCSIGIVGADQNFQIIEGDALQAYLDLLDSGTQEDQGQAPMETED